MKLIRTIRLDPSDTFVFASAAEPGEWAVSGGFVFFGADATGLAGKARAAFRSGFLGVDSLGWSTLVQIVEATESEHAALIERLAEQLVQHFGAPDLTRARAAAAEEVAFAASLCDHPAGTLIAVHRVHEDGAIRETFRTLRPREGQEKPLRAFAFMQVEGEEEPAEALDLVGLARDGALTGGTSPRGETPPSGGTPPGGETSPGGGTSPGERR
jgi:phenylpyruvate tautomerase PptA (4-oxalocrotonate tautomerase family)